jgi:2-polyprenyl-3-methyl-5-hydroxy-6-metoxy-1,4-benzoquinol methylase
MLMAKMILPNNRNPQYPQGQDVVELGVSTAHSTGDYGLSKRISIIKKFTDIRGKSILDIGCGNGYYSLVLAQSAEKVVGIDIRPNAIKRAQGLSAKNRTENLDFCLMSGNHLGFISESFDIIILIEVLEHTAEPLKVLRSANRILKGEGVLALSVPNKFFPFETHSIRIGNAKIEPPIPLVTLLPSKIRRNFESARVYTLAELTRILRLSGFTVVDKAGLFPYYGDGESSGLRSMLRKISNNCENVPFLQNLGMSLFLFAMKRRNNECEREETAQEVRPPMRLS